MFTGKREHFWVESFGWLGIIAILGAYGFLVTDVVTPHGLWYPLLNGSGSLAVLWLSWTKRAFQPMVLNLVWLAISIYSLGAWWLY
jgi:formate-dependent nitrite reductase membrane component NrfD